MAEEEEESLVLRRPKRSTAGNRMELALAEFTPEESLGLEEDVDFVVEKDEEDIFESDFVSTDEEAAQEDVDEGDRTAREEERRERKTARSRVEKATAAAHERQRVTFNHGTTSSQRKSKLIPKPRRRVSLGVVVDAETGEVIEGGAGATGVKRQSQRRHTIMNTSATVNRIKDAEEKRAAIPKKTKMATRLPTQDELIARALDTEEGNITEHRDYLRLEEEKRAKARVVKQAVEGPVLRWISKKETIQVEVQPPPPLTTTATRANLYAGNYNFAYTSAVGAGGVGSQAYSMPFYAYTPATSQTTALKPHEAAGSGSVTLSSHSSGNPEMPSGSPSTVSPPLRSHSPSLPPSTSSSSIQDLITPAVSSAQVVSSSQQQPQQLQRQHQAQVPAQTQVQPQAEPQSSAQPQPPPVLFPCPPVPTTPIVTHRTEQVCKNYVIHELSQSIPSNPTWKDTMSAMFGNHVQWDEVRVFTGKGRPMGQPAKYRDPRTNVPFANIGAYDVLTRVLGRGYAWCSALGCYVGVSETSQKHGDMAESVAEGQENGSAEEVEEGLEDRATKRRRVGIQDG